MTTGERIRSARQQKGFTQRELAEKIGIAPAGIGQWENDVRNPKLSSLLKIATALDIDYRDLVGDDDPKRDSLRPMVSINDSEINGLVDDLLLLQHTFQETGNPITDERRELWLKEQVAKRTQEPIKTNILTQLAAKRLGWFASDDATAENSSADQFIQELTDLMKTMNLDGRMAILHHARELARIPDYQKSIP